jgi:hypothetical protein
LDVWLGAKRKRKLLDVWLGAKRDWMCGSAQRGIGCVARRKEEMQAPGCVARRKEGLDVWLGAKRKRKLLDVWLGAKRDWMCGSAQRGIGCVARRKEETQAPGCVARRKEGLDVWLGAKRKRKFLDVWPRLMLSFSDCSNSCKCVFATPPAMYGPLSAPTL